MVCSISPYFTDEELIETMRLGVPDYAELWLIDWETILSRIQEGPAHFWVSIMFSGKRKLFVIDKITGGVLVEDL